MPSTYNLSGHLYNNAGVPIAGAKVNLFKKNTATSAGGSSATTDTSGYYTISPGSTLSEQAQVDVRVTNAATGAVRRIKYDDVTAQKAVVVRNVHLSPDSNQVNSSGGFHTTLAATGLQGASHTVTFPMLTGGALVTATPQSSAGAITLSSAEAVVSSGAITGTVLRGTTSLQVASGATVTTIDNGDLGTGSATRLATQGAIKTYVDAQVDTEDTIAELNDTNIGSLAAGHILVYDNTASVWDNVALSGGTGLTATLGDGTLALAVDAAQTGINSILAANLIIGEDAETAIDFGTNNEIDFKINNTTELTLDASALYPTGDAGLDLGTSTLEFKDAFFDGTVTSDAFAGPLTGDVTGNASGTAATVTAGTQAQITTLTNVVTVGELVNGSIASGFGTINNGSNTITTTGLVTAGSLTVSGTTTLNGALVLGDAAGDTLDITASATVSTDFKFADDIDIALGSNADILMRNRSTSAAANLEITDIIIGTSVHPGVAANSLLVSNITASGDMMFVTNRGGNSEAHMLFDASAGDTFLYARGVEAMKITGGGAIVVTPSITANGGVAGDLTGDVTGNADTVTTNANLTGDVTSSGNATTIASAAVDFAHIQNVAANSILGRNANSSGVLSEVALATTQILIGDGTGFTAAALSGDATMTNGGVVTVASASTSAAGKVELATSAEITTATSEALAMTPGLYSDSIFGTRYVQIVVLAAGTDLTTGNGKAHFHVPPGLNGMDLVYVHAEVQTAPAGETGGTGIIIQIHNATDGSDMLTAGSEQELTIDASHTGSDQAGTAAVIVTGEDDVATNDVLRIDIDQVGSSTAGAGLIVTMGFRIP